MTARKVGPPIDPPVRNVRSRGGVPHAGGVKTQQTQDAQRNRRDLILATATLDKVREMVEALVARVINDGDARAWAALEPWIFGARPHKIEVESNKATVVAFQFPDWWKPPSVEMEDELDGEEVEVVTIEGQAVELPALPLPKPAVVVRR